MSADLDRLAAEARAAHARVRESGASMVAHAVECGTALIEAQRQLAGEDFTAWVRERVSGLSRTTAYKYMRLAHYTDLVAEARPVSIDAALTILAEQPGRNGRERILLPDECKAELVRLVDSGLSLGEVAERFDVSPSTVHYWTNPKGRARAVKLADQRRRKAARALARQERDRLAAKAGGTVAEGYALIRRAAQALERAHGEAEAGEAKVALSSAITSLYEAEDHIVRALGAQHGTARPALKAAA